MAEKQRKNWRELCSAALSAKDPNELLEIVQELTRVFKGEEQAGSSGFQGGNENGNDGEFPRNASLRKVS